eukprot:jgi/Botrbrau1/15290/Bobra.97_1s0015.1
MEAPKVAPLGPRLPGRCSADLIQGSPQFHNPVNEYTLDLRANKIPVIENLGVTQNQFDVIDFTDNIIVLLEGFPKLRRLKTLFVSNNRIMRIGRHLEGTPCVFLKQNLKKVQGG